MTILRSDSCSKPAIEAAKRPEGYMTPSDVDARRSVSETLMQVSEDIHDLSYRLHPSVLHDLGLVEALKAECERVARSGVLRVDVEADKLPTSLPSEVALVSIVSDKKLYAMWVVMPKQVSCDYRSP